MTEPLRPMSTGQLLDHTVALYRRNFLLFVGFAVVGPTASVIYQLITIGSAVVPAAGRHAPGSHSRFGVSFLIGWTILLAGMAIANAGTVRAVAAVPLGQNISIIRAYGALRGRITRVLGVFFLATLASGLATLLAVFVLAFVFVILSLGSWPRASVGATVAAGIGMVTVFLATYIRYALAIQACVVEDLGIRDSLKRSVQLSKGSRWRIATIYVVFLALSWIATYALQYVALKTGTRLHNRTAAITLFYLAGFISGSVTGPLATIGISLLYYDERVRKEAFDLQLMFLSLDAATSPPAGIPAQI
jgi:hypothetical protein